MHCWSPHSFRKVCIVKWYEYGRQHCLELWRDLNLYLNQDNPCWVYTWTLVSTSVLIITVLPTLLWYLLSAGAICSLLQCNMFTVHLVLLLLHCLCFGRPARKKRERWTALMFQLVGHIFVCWKYGKSVKIIFISSSFWKYDNKYAHGRLASLQKHFILGQTDLLHPHFLHPPNNLNIAQELPLTLSASQLECVMCCITLMPQKLWSLSVPARKLML